MVRAEGPDAVSSHDLAMLARPSDDARYARSRELMARAERVVPGGIYGHQSPAFLVPAAYPSFLAEAKGCRIRDVDGNEYIDFLCGYGPIVLGHRHPKVEEAADRQRRQVDTQALPSERFVELAERLVGITPRAAWAVFAKNGSDVCTWSLAVARVATGRPLVAMVDHTYHGVHGWCNPLPAGFLPAEREAMRTFAWNDLEGLRRIFDAEAARVAAVIVTPFRHEALENSVLPAPGFLEGVRALCDRHGAVMIVDDVRAGFRLDLRGSTQRWGVTPDLLLYSKALANGYPLSAMIGAEALRTAAKSVFVTGTAFTQAVPIAAALATIDEIEQSGAIEIMDRAGRRFCEGLEQLAAVAGLEVTISGPPAIPFMTFADDAGKFDRNRVFGAACARRGVFLHPVHNWFVSAAHTDADIDAALEIAAAGFAEVKAAF